MLRKLNGSFGVLDPSPTVLSVLELSGLMNLVAGAQPEAGGEARGGGERDDRQHGDGDEKPPKAAEPDHATVMPVPGDPAITPFHNSTTGTVVGVVP